MNVGIENVAYNMECDFCGKKWLALVEADRIEWPDGSVEVSHGQLLECPACGKWTEIDLTQE